MSAPYGRVAIPKGHTVPHGTYEIICETLIVLFLLPEMPGSGLFAQLAARTVEVVLQTLQQFCDLIGVVHVGFPLADHTVFVDDNCGPFPV